MAAIGKIRSWGPWLIGIIGLGLFGFIAGDMWRSCEATSNQRRQLVGEVLGNKLYIQDYQQLIDEYQEVLKIQGNDNLSEDQLNSLKDYVWENYVQGKMIEAEAKKLGLIVTDEEVANVFKEGTNPVLYQLPMLPQFFNQQTRQFDYNQVTFIYSYMKQQMNSNPQVAEEYRTFDKYWKYIEKTLRQQLLTQKYQNLVAACLISNPVSAKKAFTNQNSESDVLLASLAYNGVNDNDIEVTDADLKAKYAEMKPQFKQDNEVRDIKYVAYQVVPSEKDRAELMAQMNEVQQLFSDGTAPAEVIRKGQSQVPYRGLFVTRAGLPADVARQLDSMQVGQTSAPFETRSDNTMNVVKYLAKAQMPDSVEFRVIQVGGRTLDASAATADSIYQALKAGAVFDTIAKQYGQTGEKVWLTSANIQGMQNLDADNKAYFETIMSLATGELKNLKLTQGNAVIQVTDRKNMVEKYDVAIVKRPIVFSNETYTEAYNKFSQFVTENQSIEALEEAAPQYGYTVQSRQGLTSTTHNIANIHGTHEAVRWAFENKTGAISQLFDRCGNNDYLLVVALGKIHPVGYLDQETVSDMLKQEVMKDKKFQKLAEQLSGAKTIAEAQQKGARVDTVRQITFQAPVFVQATGASEPALSGAVAAVEKGAVSPKVVKGNGGAYLFQVLERADREGATFDAAQTQQQLSQQAVQNAFRSIVNDLKDDAKIVDKRYLYF